MKRSILQYIFSYFVIVWCAPGFWLSYPLLKSGLLLPKGAEKKQSQEEMGRFIISTVIGATLFWSAVAIGLAIWWKRHV